MNLTTTLETLVCGGDLSAYEATSAMEALVNGEISEVQASALLTALRSKGATPTELTAFSSVLRSKMVALNHTFDDLVDTCGTGGGPSTFNISTAAAIVAAAAGARVAKHGNRAVTSKCGSADVLEFLGVRLTAEPEHLLHLLETVRLAFLFAPAHHPALKLIGPVRKALGIRTVFNQLGPLLNPANASIQLIGVYDRRLARPMIEALKNLGSTKAAVGCGDNGLDEISPSEPSHFWVLEHGSIQERVLTPELFEISPVPFEEIRAGDTVAENASLLRKAISEPGTPYANAVIPSAAMALWLSGKAASLGEAGRLANDVIISGVAHETLETLIRESAL